MLQIGQNQNHL